MYFPFFYGKQFELLAIRDFSSQVSPDNIFPIIEPVKSNLNSLKLACDALISQNFNFIIIANPSCGELQGTKLIDDFLNGNYTNTELCYKGILVSQDTTANQLQTMVQESKHKCFLIHLEVSDQFSEICDFLAKDDGEKVVGHVFLREKVQDTKIKKIKNLKKSQHFVCLRDGFNKQRNADYKPKESFSDQHITYTDSFTGFSDYLIAGQEYSESGGPAYAVAIHLTFLDGADDDIMKIFHFVSDTTESTEDPAGKFIEALDKMIDTVNNPPKGVTLKSPAIDEFKRLHAEQHYPGLGFLKKLSMLHHVQILDQYLKNNKD